MPATINILARLLVKMTASDLYFNIDLGLYDRHIVNPMIITTNSVFIHFTRELSRTKQVEPVGGQRDFYIYTF